MSQTGVLAPEGLPRTARPAGLHPVLVGETDRPWGALAQQLGVDAFYPVVVVPEAPPADYRPAAQPVLETVETVEAPADPPQRVYTLGGTAVEAAGVARADHLPGEAATRARYQRFLGGVAMHQSVEAATAEAPATAYRSSLDLLREAAAGKAESHQALLTNVKTHVYEILGGVGEGMQVTMAVDEQGRVLWNGQTGEARQFHTLTAYPNQSAQMLAVRHAEGLGGFRGEDLNRRGQLEGKVLFDFSAMANASHQELSDQGFFLNSIAACIRRVRFTDRTCDVSTVFVAGVDQRQFAPKRGETETEEITRQTEALASRFDIAVLRKMYGLFGVAGAETMEPDELLATQIIAPDTLDELDMAMLYDTVAAELLDGNEKTFFGSVELWQELGSPEQLTREQYVQHMQQRQKRQADFDALCEQIVDVQISRHAEALTPRQAVDLKRRVVLDMLVDRAIDEGDIDAARLGREAAAHAAAARARYEAGDKDGGDRHRSDAKDKAQDPSCPPGERDKLLKRDGEDKEHDKHDCNEVKDGDRVHCPYCDQTVTARVPKKGGRIYCSNKRCGAAYQKESMQEKLFDRNKNNAPKPTLFNPLASGKKPTNASPKA